MTSSSSSSTSSSSSKNDNGKSSGPGDCPKLTPDKSLLIVEPTGEHLGTIVALHGMSGNGEVFKKLLEPLLMGDEFIRQHVRWIFPTAPRIHIDIANCKMTAWYNILGVKLTTPEDREGMDKSKQFVHGIIEKEMARGVPSERIMVCGVSQGGAMALFSSLTFKGGRLGGCICVSGWVPQYRGFFFNPWLCKLSRKTPIMFCHGKQDTSVRHTFGLASCRFVQIYLRWGRGAQFFSYDDLDHYSTNDKQMQDISKFLYKHLKLGELQRGQKRTGKKDGKIKMK